jgi:hypothetical protein
MIVGTILDVVIANAPSGNGGSASTVIFYTDLEAQNWARETSRGQSLLGIVVVAYTQVYNTETNTLTKYFDASAF